MDRNTIKTIILVIVVVAIVAGLGWAMREPPQAVDLAAIVDRLR